MLDKLMVRVDFASSEEDTGTGLIEETWEPSELMDAETVYEQFITLLKQGESFGTIGQKLIQSLVPSPSDADLATIGSYLWFTGYAKQARKDLVERHPSSTAERNAINTAFLELNDQESLLSQECDKVLARLSQGLPNAYTLVAVTSEKHEVLSERRKTWDAYKRFRRMDAAVVKQHFSSDEISRYATMRYAEEVVSSYDGERVLTTSNFRDALVITDRFEGLEDVIFDTIGRWLDVLTSEAQETLLELPFRVLLVAQEKDKSVAATSSEQKTAKSVQRAQTSRRQGSRITAPAGWEKIGRQSITKLEAGAYLLADSDGHEVEFIWDGKDVVYYGEHMSATHFNTQCWAEVRGVDSTSHAGSNPTGSLFKRA